MLTTTRTRMGNATRASVVVSLIAGLHIAALWQLSWVRRSHDNAEPARTGAIVFVRTPALSKAVHRHTAPPLHRARQPPAPRQRLVRPVVPRAAVVRPVVARAAVVPPEAESEAPLPVPQGPQGSSMLERAKAEARLIEGESPTRVEKGATLSLEGRLAQGIAAAFKPRTNSIEEIRGIDGSPITKVSGPMGTYCVKRDSNGPGGGRDPFRTAARDKIINCPR